MSQRKSSLVGGRIGQMDKPLHVRVAEALGWPDGNVPDWFASANRDDETLFPRYDTSWEATGPLIERFRISVLMIVNTESPEWEAIEDACAGHDGELWNVRGIGRLPVPPDYEEPTDSSSGPTPLIAVCNLILALSAAGKFRAEATLSPPSP